MQASQLPELQCMHHQFEHPQNTQKTNKPETETTHTQNETKRGTEPNRTERNRTGGKQNTNKHTKENTREESSTRRKGTHKHTRETKQKGAGWNLPSEMHMQSQDGLTERIACQGKNKFKNKLNWKEEGQNPPV
jgi:hypothetical protein